MLFIDYRQFKFNNHNWESREPMQSFVRFLFTNANVNSVKMPQSRKIINEVENRERELVTQTISAPW